MSSKDMNKDLLLLSIESHDLLGVRSVVNNLLKLKPLPHEMIAESSRFVDDYINKQEENESLEAYREIAKYLKRALKDIKERMSVEQELNQALEAKKTIKKDAKDEENEIGGDILPAPDSQRPIDELIEKKKKNNTLVSEDANGVKHCYFLELAIKSNNVDLVIQLLKIKTVSASIQSALETVQQQGTAVGNNIPIVLLKTQKKYKSNLKKDNVKKDIAASIVTAIVTTASSEKKLSIFDKYFFGITTSEKLLEKEASVYTDANGEDRCYALEYLVEKGLLNLVEVMLEKDAVNQNSQVIEAALKVKNTDPKINSALSKALYNIKAQERGKVELKDTIKETFASIDPIKKAEALALQNAMLKHKVKDMKDVSNLYKISDTPETTHDREYYNSVYNALAETVNRERHDYVDEAHAQYVQYRNMVQQHGVRSAIKVGGLVAVGLTSGGVGLGIALLAPLIGLAVTAGYGEWKNKYHILEEEHKKLLSESETLLKNANVKSLKKLQILINNAEGKPKEILQAQFNEVQRLQVQVEKIENEAKKASLEVLTNLLSSPDKEVQIKAKAFLDGFEHNTNTLQEAGKEAFSKLKNVAKDVTERALKKNVEATHNLNAVASPLATIGNYSELVSNVLDAQGALTKVTDLLEVHYNVLAEVKERDELYIELAKTLREQEKQIFPTQAEPLPIEKALMEIEAFLLAAKKFENPVEIGIVNNLIAATKILKEKGKDALKDPKFQSHMSNVADTPSMTTLTLIKDTVINTYKAIGQAEPSNLAQTPIGALAWLPPIQQAIMSTYQYLNEHLTAELTSGLASAHLPYGISPASSCATLSMILYSFAHNKIYTPQLKEKIEKISKLYNQKDMDKMNDKELMEVEQLVGKTIHDFSTLIPNSGENHLANSKKLYNAQVKRTQLLKELEAGHNFTFKRAIMYDTVFHDTLTKDVLEKNDTFDKALIYIKKNPQDENVLIAFFHDGDKWCSREKPKNEFKEIMRNRVNARPWEFDDAKEIKDIATFFDCVRRPAQKIRAELQQNKEELDDQYVKMDQEKLQDQALHYLTGLYRDTVNHIAVKSNTENRGRLFELSRQQTLVTLLPNMTESEQVRALPLIADYLKSRVLIIEKLYCLKLLGEISPEETQLLQNYKQAFNQPYDFLQGVTKLDDLAKQTTDIIFSEMEMLKNMNVEDVKNVVNTAQRFKLFVKEGWLDKNSPEQNEFLTQLKNIEQKPDLTRFDLTRFDAYLNSVEKLKNLKIKKPEGFDNLESKKLEEPNQASVKKMDNLQPSKSVVFSDLGSQVSSHVLNKKSNDVPKPNDVSEQDAPATIHTKQDQTKKGL